MPIHERLQVILFTEAYDPCLDPATPARDLLAMLRPMPDKAVTAYRILTRVNNVRNDDPERIVPA